MAQPQAQSQPAQEQRKHDGRQRVYLYMDGPKESDEALDYLSRYEDDAPGAKIVYTRKTPEIRLDRLTDDHIVIAIVRDINKDRMKPVLMPGVREDAPQVKGLHEFRAPVYECKPVDCAPFYTRGTSRESEDVFDDNGFINALAKTCLPACPRVQKRGDGKGGHVRWLVLKWG